MEHPPRFAEKIRGDMDTRRAQAIRAFLEKAKPEENSGQRIVLGGAGPKTFHVYRLPIRLLMYNIRNGRFASELLAKERTLKRRLDPTVKADAKEIQKLLLEQNESETKALRADLVTNNQLEPGIVTFDGAVINANRRMAVLAELHEKTGEARFENLRVSILPEAVEEKDLWRIEAGLQFAKDFRVEYGQVNELLKLREGKDCGLSEKEISASLLGRYTDKQVKERIGVLELIDSYLTSIKKQGQYNLINDERSGEKFNSLHNNVIGALKRQEADSEDVLEATEVGFALISKADVTHWDIRDLSKIYRSTEALTMLRAGINTADPLKTSPTELKEAFVSAQDVVEDEVEKEKPERLITRALSAIKSIQANSPKLKSPQVDTLLRKLSAAVNELLKKTS